MRFHALCRRHQAEVDQIEYIRLLKYNHAIYTLPTDVKVTSPHPPLLYYLFPRRVAYQMIAIDIPSPSPVVEVEQWHPKLFK